MNPRFGWKRRLGRGVLLFGVAPYLFLVGLFGAMQRSLIYIPSKEESIRPEAARLLPGRVHAIALETDDDLKLNGWHFLAEGRKAENRAECDRMLAEGRNLVLYFPGNAGNRRNRNLDCKDLADLGLDVFLFDYRGYGDNPGSPSEERLAADARSVWQYATETRDLASERILLYGESLGGAVATEVVFAWPGMGRVAVEAILTRDYPLIVATTAMAAILVVLGNLLADIGYAFVDPRLRSGS